MALDTNPMRQFAKEVGVSCDQLNGYNLEDPLGSDEPFDPDPEEENGDSPRFKEGHSLAWYANQAIDPGQTLLGNRYLCRSGGMFVVAPSGMGKSTFSLQMAILWCCGLVAFGIKPNKALRILIVQSEDDQGDCTEMAQVMNHLELTGKEKSLVEENTELIRCNDCVGHRFIEALKARLTDAKNDGKPFDILIINPYGVFLGDDVKNTSATTKFLNEWLNPVLDEFSIAAIIVHHTPKTNFQNTDNYKIWDWMYWGAGCATITNWARAILVIKPESDDLTVFRFIAAKRGKRIGAEWNGDFERYYQWSTIPGVLRWEGVPDDQVGAIQQTKTKRKTADLDVALKQVPVLDPIPKDMVLEKIMTECKVGNNLARRVLNELIYAEKAFDVLIPKVGRGRRMVGICQSRPC
jgi:AAA domain